MKKLILAIMFAVSTLFVTAQVVQVPVVSLTSSTYGAATDTVDATSAQYMVSTALPPMVSVTAVATFVKITGIITGTATLEASLDGNNWVSVYNSKVTSYSYTVTDIAAQSFAWQLTDYPTWKYLRVAVTGSSGPSFTVAAKIYGVRRQ